MADLVRDHVRRREVAGRAEALRELLEERGVEVDLLVGGAVERAAGGAGHAACRPRGVVEAHELRRLVARAHRLEQGRPHVLGVAHDAAHEVHLRIGRGLRALRRRRLRLLRRRRDHGTAAFQHAEDRQRIDAEEQAHDDDQDDRAAAEAHAAAQREAAAAARASAFLDVVARTHVAPTHGRLLLLRMSRFYFACAMALAKSWYSSQPLPQMRSSAARCSCAFALLPVSTYASPTYSCAPLCLGSSLSASL